MIQSDYLMDEMLAWFKRKRGAWKRLDVFSDGSEDGECVAGTGRRKKGVSGIEHFNLQGR